MSLLARVGDDIRQPNISGEHARCTHCDERMIGRCGDIVVWHWAHEHAETCDPWSAGESEWHLGWKLWFQQRGAAIEVSMGAHRADVVLPDGSVVELQNSRLNVENITAREDFYGRMRWIYNCDWSERLERAGKYDGGFRWYNGSPSMAAHRWPLWWDIGRNRLARVTLRRVESRMYGQVRQVVDVAKLDWISAPVDDEAKEHLYAAFPGTEGVRGGVHVKGNDLSFVPAEWGQEGVEEADQSMREWNETLKPDKARSGFTMPDGERLALFKCPHCARRFATLLGGRLHLYFAHGEIDPTFEYTCHRCDYPRSEREEIQQINRKLRKRDQEPVPMRVLGKLVLVCASCGWDAESARVHVT